MKIDKILTLLFLMCFCNTIFGQDTELLELHRRIVAKKDSEINKLQKQNRDLQERINTGLSGSKTKDKKLEELMSDYYSVQLLLKEKEKELNDLRNQLNSIYTQQNNPDLGQLMSSLNDIIEKIGNINNQNNTYETYITQVFISENNYYIIDNSKKEAITTYINTSQNILQLDKPSDSIKSSPQTNSRYKKTSYLLIGSGVGVSYSGIGLKLDSRLGGNVGVGLQISGGIFPGEAIVVGGGLKFYFHKSYFINCNWSESIEIFWDSAYQKFGSVTVGSNYFFNKGQLGLNISLGALKADFYAAGVGEWSSDIIPIGDLGLIYKF